MITITFNTRGFRVEGHAEYDVRGKDIVCSAISAMTQMTLIGLLRAARVSHYSSEGFLQVLIEDTNNITFTLMYAFEESVKHVKEQYPDYVKIKEENT